jgi:hypothetical protein
MYNISTLVGLPGITVTALPWLVISLQFVSPCTVSADCFLPADCTPFARDQYLKTGFFVCLRERERERKKERKQEMLSLLFSCVSPNAPNVPIYAWLGFGACLPVSLLLCLYIVNSYSVWRHPLIMWFLFAPPSPLSCAPLRLNSLGPTFVFSRAHCILQILTLNFTPVFWSKTYVFVNSFDSRTKEGAVWKQRIKRGGVGWDQVCGKGVWGGWNGERGGEPRLQLLPQSIGPIWVVDIKFRVGRLSITRTESQFTPCNYEVRSLPVLSKIRDPVSGIYITTVLRC